MEFNFYLGQLFKSDEEGLAIISGDSVPKSINSQLTTVLDNIGVASAKVKLILILGSRTKSHYHNWNKIHWK